MSDYAIYSAFVSDAYKKLAASVVLGALSSLAVEGSTKKAHIDIVRLYRSGRNASQISRELDLPLGSIRGVIDRMGSDPRSFLRSDSPFVEHCGITKSSIRGIIDKIDTNPEEAKRILKEIRRWSQMIESTTRTENSED